MRLKHHSNYADFNDIFLQNINTGSLSTNFAWDKVASACYFNSHYVSVFHCKNFYTFAFLIGTYPKRVRNSPLGLRMGGGGGGTPDPNKINTNSSV